jgi:hypothetical protein
MLLHLETCQGTDQALAVAPNGVASLRCRAIQLTAAQLL